MEERLQKILARAGYCARRACEELITAGRVTVDGAVVTELGARADPATALIEVDGQPVKAERLRYIVLHKPAGYLSGPDVRAGYPSWQDLVNAPQRLYAVGRLDLDSEGLLLLTNDGDLANRLAHPRYEHPKTYLVQVAGIPNPRKIRRLQHGVMLDDGPTAPAAVELLRRPPLPFASLPSPAARSAPPAPNSQPGTHREPKSVPKRAAWLQITIREGRKRQLRRMVALLGHPALRVIRIRLGTLELGDLRPGKWRDLAAGEVRALRSMAAAPAPATSAAAAKPERKATPLVPSIIAIDGPAASGKSTIGGRLAHELGYLYFDTGVMYRAITWVAIAREVPTGDEAAVTQLAESVRLDVLPPTVQDGRDVTVLADDADITPLLRRPEVEQAVSPVSAYAGVRAAMVLQQRRIGQAGKIVMVGRDIGTVVLPKADLKIYLDASLAERSHRRYLECRGRGRTVSEEQVMEELRRRDLFDSSRQHSPLSVAHDAVVVDSTELTIEQVMQRMHTLIQWWGEKQRATT